MADNDEAKIKNSTPETTCHPPWLPRPTVEEAFNDYLGRRCAIIKALTTDVDKFLNECSPEKPDLCLFGLPDGQWKVEPPPQDLPSTMREPAIGINWAMELMKLEDWIFFVACHSEAWLISTALHCFTTPSDRETLFKRINEGPTVTEVVDQFVVMHEGIKFWEKVKNKHFTALQEKWQTARPTVKEVFDDFAGRRDAIIKALTTELEDFLRKIENVKEIGVGLYGRANGDWELREAKSKERTIGMALKIRDPMTGINFGREGIPRIEWLRLVAVHSDAWLISTAFFNAHFHKYQREELFEMINELSTVTEIIDEIAKKEEEEDNFCGSCKGRYEDGEFWIWCDYCETWYHGQCVGVTPLQANYIDKFKCPIKCNNINI